MALAARRIPLDDVDQTQETPVEDHMASFTDYTPPRRKMEWKRAWRALRILIRDSERTDQVFEIIRALAGNSWERNFQQFCAHPEGRRLLQERPDLFATLADRDALRRLPEGSFGRTYLAFMEAGALTPEGLMEAEVQNDAEWPKETPPDADHQFFGDRIRDMHDLWHVLTGYGRDEAGEAANLAFSLAQVPEPGIALIVLTSAVIGPKDVRLSWPRYLLAAFNRGRQAALLTSAPYERLLDQPLDDVRRLLRVQPAHEAHPDGIAVGNRTDAPTGDGSANGSANGRVWEMRRA
jgi:ubiquinone biosynthesis protein COQ4